MVMVRMDNGGDEDECEDECERVLMVTVFKFWSDVN